MIFAQEVDSRARCSNLECGYSASNLAIADQLDKKVMQ